MQLIQNNDHIDLETLDESFFIHDAEVNFFQKNLIFSVVKKDTASKSLNEKDLIEASFYDIGVLLHVLANGNTDISFSLDFEENNINSPNNVKIYKPDLIKGIKIGEDLFKADYLMKQMALGTKVITLNPFRTMDFFLPTDLIKKGLRNIYSNPNNNIGSNGGRIWINFGLINQKIENNTDFNFKLREHSNLSISYQKMVSDQNGVITFIPDEVDPENPIFKFSQSLTECFNLACNYYPEYKRVKEIANALIIAKYILLNKISYCKKWSFDAYQKNLIENYNKNNMQDTLEKGKILIKKSIWLNGLKQSNFVYDTTMAQELILTDKIPRIEVSKNFIQEKKTTLQLNGVKNCWLAKYKNFSLVGGVVFHLNLKDLNNSSNISKILINENVSKNSFDIQELIIPSHIKNMKINKIHSFKYGNGKGEFKLYQGKVSKNAYSGNQEFYNQEKAQDKENQGPIPVGIYKVLSIVNHPKRGPLAIKLEWKDGPNSYGRSKFYIHGDNKLMNHTASEGCIIIEKELRKEIKIGDLIEVSIEKSHE